VTKKSAWSEEDLRATEDSLRHDAHRLIELEEEKSRLDQGDPRVDALSAEIERLTKGIAEKGKAERELSGEVTPDAADSRPN
jgi:hypothetical protein